MADACEPRQSGNEASATKTPATTQSPASAWVSRVRFSFQALQVGSHCGCTLVTLLAVFLQCGVDDFFELGGNPGFNFLADVGVRFRIASCKIGAVWLR